MRLAALLTPLLLFLLPAAPVAASRDALRVLPEEAFTRNKAAHLLRRAGFGGTPEEIEALHARGLRGAVDYLVDYERIRWSEPPDLGIEVRTPPGRDELRGKSDEERREIRRRFRSLDQRQARGLKDWWLRRMILTPRPLEERMTLFWHGHFTSAYRQVRNSYRMYVQNATFRGLATGSFRELLHEVSRDPAMLRYLDGDRNRKGQPNENFAREVMELFTLGEGHYTEEDIQEAARAFTGWTVRDGDFVFDPRLHDEGKKDVLGRRGKFDGHDVLEILLAKRETPKRLAHRLLAQFVVDEPPQPWVDALAQVVRRHRYEMKPVLRKLFLSRAFYSPEAMGTKVKSPVDLVVGLHRSLGIAPPDTLPLSRLTAILGQDVLDPPNVKGWDGGRGWITTSHLLNRYNIAVAIVGEAEDRMALARAGLRTRGLAPRGRASRRGTRGAPFYEAAADLADRGLETPEEVVDHYVDRLLARPLGPRARETLVAYLRGDERRDVRRADRVHGLLRLLVSIPEFQLY